MDLLLLAEATSFEPSVRVATSFAFGFLTGLWFWIWFPMMCIALLLEGIWCTKSTHKEQYADAGFAAVIILITLHLFGVLDLVHDVLYQWDIVLMGLGVLAGFGLCIYSPIRGYYAARKARPELHDRLASEKEHWLGAQQSRLKDDFDADAAEAEWQESVKEEKWKRITSVDRDRGKIFFWTFFWPLDLLWHGVFKWVQRLQDVFRFIWKRIRGAAQGVKDHALKGAVDDL